jgi:hypothetical protein
MVSAQLIAIPIVDWCSAGPRPTSIRIPRPWKALGKALSNGTYTPGSMVITLPSTRLNAQLQCPVRPTQTKTSSMER